MSNVRCPMCGKLNAEELDICQFCQARLKPLIISSEPTNPDAQPNNSQSNESHKKKNVSHPDSQEQINNGGKRSKKDTDGLDEAIPPWLQSLREDQDQSLEEQPSDNIVAEIMSSKSEHLSVTDSSQEEQPDFLATLKAQSSEEAQEVPDWLANIRIGIEKEESKPPDQQTPAAESSAIWAAHQNDNKPEDEFAYEISSGKLETEFPSDDNLSDWLKHPQDTTPVATEPVVIPTEIHEKKDDLNRKGDYPVPTEEKRSEEESKQQEELHLQDTVPKPLVSIDQERISFSDQATVLEIGSPDGKPTSEAFIAEQKEVSAGIKETETPDWISKLQSFMPISEDTNDDKNQTSSEVSPAENLPDWLQSINQKTSPTDSAPALISEEKQAPSVGETDAIFSLEAPEWLHRLKPESSKAEIEQSKGQSLDEELKELAPAELPSWVQAMRPIEAVNAETKTVATEEGYTTENHGPLAGLAGVLPTGLEIGQFRKPPVYSDKLHVTEDQKRYATSLEQLLSNEAKGQPVSSSKRKISSRLIRWILTLIFIVAVSIPLITAKQIVSEPVMPIYSPELLAVKDFIDSLPAGAPVLIAFDYEPALSGELEAASTPLINHLLLKGPRLTLISTSPTGPLLAEHFMQTQQSAHGYQSGQGYVNLGYLAGGQVGILSFTEKPAETSPLAFNGEPAWQLPPLQGIQNLNDFAAVIILTDNVETGRVWIEQTGPYLGESPLIFAISAQAEPIIHPYYDSDQIKGIVSGLAGGRAYEQATGLFGTAHEYWHAFSSGILVAEILIVAGGVWNAVIGWRTRRRTSMKED